MKGIVWLASYPKSGNTWFRAFLSNLNHGGDQPVDINAFDYTNFAARTGFERVLGWESSDLTQAELEEARIPVQEAYGRQGMAAFKVHEAFADPRTGRLLFSREATRSVLYFIRNPLDVAVSFSHHRGKDVDDTIARMADSGAVLGANQESLELQLPQPMGTWSHHVRSWIDDSEVPVHVLRYEDMLKCPQQVFSEACRIAGFPDDAKLVALALRHSTFEVLKQQEEVRGFREALGGRAFFRRGQAGRWRELLSSEQVSAIVREHGEVMKRFGYLSADGTPV